MEGFRQPDQQTARKPGIDASGDQVPFGPPLIDVLLPQQRQRQLKSLGRRHRW
jgi:hypothetical protein